MIKTMIEKQWYNLKDASEYLGVSKSRLYDLTGSRKIKFFQPGGKLIFFKEEDLDAWILSGQKEIIAV